MKKVYLWAILSILMTGSLISYSHAEPQGSLHTMKHEVHEQEVSKVAADKKAPSGSAEEVQKKIQRDVESKYLKQKETSPQASSLAQPGTKQEINSQPLQKK